MNTFASGVLEAMNRFEQAVREDTLNGDLIDRSEIDKELKEARDELEDLLSQIP